VESMSINKVIINISTELLWLPQLPKTTREPMNCSKFPVQVAKMEEVNLGKIKI
jgi:hypothetical protein